MVSCEFGILLFMSSQIIHSHFVLYFVVTLDGHGQRDKHEVVITPYLQDGVTRNQLISVIGPKALAMLSDLFSAPSIEAPNIRSAVCHGSWDREIIKELRGLASAHDNTLSVSVKSDTVLVDTTGALISSLDLISSNMNESLLTKRALYRPVYTYTSAAVRNLSHVFRRISELDMLISSNPAIVDCIKTMENQQPKLCSSLRSMTTDLRLVKHTAHILFPTMKEDGNEIWTVENTYIEHKTNIALAGNIAALALITDCSNAIDRYLSEVKERIDNFDMVPSSTKERRALKTTARFCSSAMVVQKFYTFTVYVALATVLQDLQQKVQEGRNKDDDQNKLRRADLVRLVERSRMTISTFDSHLATNLDRSLKAVQTFLQGKLVKNFNCTNQDR